MSKPDGPYRVTDNSGSFTGRGWRLSGPDGFEVYSDHQETLARQNCSQKNKADHAVRVAIQKMLMKQAELLLSLNTDGVPAEFKDKHRIEASVLQHAAAVVGRHDLNWNNEALDAMERFVMNTDKDPHP